ncbi:MAG: AraC family transcriptional regulator [Deltaproteobacteria bacterium]|nr:AraC family transcriptional regulator [Nannocystaceae bacterium]
MSLGIPRVLRTRDPGDPPRWELARAHAHPRLRACVEGYAGYWERADAPLVRRELPVPKAVLIIDFGPPLHIVADDASFAAHAAGFVAGLSDRVTVTRHGGFSQGIQVDLTPIGAHRLTGVPARLLADAVVGLGDVFGSAGPSLTARLQELPSWEARFDVLDTFLLARLERARAVPRIVVAAHQRIVASHGAITVSELARELGISRKHLIAGFHEHVGLAPKLFGQVVRFHGAIAHVLADGSHRDWARIATAAGYYDQAHLIRDVRRFSGYTPGELVRHLLPDLGGFG